LNSEVPDLATFVKHNPPKTKAGKAAMAALISLDAPTNPFLFMAAPRNTPVQYVEALRDAFTSAMAQTSIKAAFLANNTLPGAYPGQKLDAYIQQQLKATPIFRKFITPNP